MNCPTDNHYTNDYFHKQIDQNWIQKNQNNFFIYNKFASDWKMFLTVCFLELSSTLKRRLSKTEKYLVGFQVFIQTPFGFVKENTIKLNCYYVPYYRYVYESVSRSYLNQLIPLSTVSEKHL